MNKHEQYTTIIEHGIIKTFYYSDFHFNKGNLTLDILNNLEELKNLDPVKAQSWYHGYHSAIKGAVFARYLDLCNKKNVDFSVEKITGGLDIGYSTSPTGHPTSAALWFIGKSQAHKVAEYYHSNATMQFKSTEELAEDIIQFYKRQALIFPFIKIKRLTCYVDWGNGGEVFINNLEKIRNAQDINWLTFVKVDKELMHLRDRVDFTTACMAKRIITYNWDNLPYSKKHYSMIQWLDKTKLDTANNEPKLLDKYDDEWDADCYALMFIMKQLMTNASNDLLFSQNYQGEKLWNR